MSEIEKFDPSKLMDGVKDRIKATFVSMLPDDAWEALVKKEIDAFFEPTTGAMLTLKFITTNHNYYGSGGNQKWDSLEVAAGVSPFRALVWTLCYQQSLDTLKEYLNKEYFSTYWVNNQPEVKDKMKEVIADAAPQALLNLMHSITLSHMSTMQSQANSFR